MKKFYKILEKKVSIALINAGYRTEEVVVNESSRPDLGEYQFNGVMALAKEYHKNPLEIANAVLEQLQKDAFFKNVNIAGPGFINMTISDEALISFTNDNDYTYTKNGKLIFLDYGGANVAKSLHVGHLRSANIGESLKRLCKYLGYDTISDTHLGDWGRPLGLVILELSKRHPDWLYFDEKYNGEYPEVEITNALLEEIYPYASAKAKEDENYLKEAQKMTTKLQNGVRGIISLWNKIMEVSKTDIKKIYDRLNTHFDLYKGESDAETYVPEMLSYLDTLNIVEESEGAKVINVAEDSDKLEIPPMLLIKSDGGILYSTTELATIYDRMKNFNPDEIWYIVDKRQDLHFTQVFRTAYKSKIAKESTKLVFAGFGTMNGSDGKPFKTRDGGVMRLNDLLALVKDESLKRLSENITENRDEIAEKIAMSAVKYADLLPNRESDYIFDIEKFCDLDGKTGPYILYSTIRMKSLLNKAEEAGISYNKINVIDNEFDKDVILNLNNLDNVLNKSFNYKSLNDITEYIYKLTTSYNRFYTENVILKESDELKRESWLYLTKTVYEVNKILLDILAIELPDKM
ncbi:MAG: arginine--tRNA ligase [Firmicutes bacterium]|nr:arginine--tRNA ligase [Bacillota bacterium]